MGNTSTKHSTTTSEDRFGARPRRRSLRNSLRFSKTSSKDVLLSTDKYLQSLNEDFEKGVIYHKKLNDLKIIENDLNEILTDLQNIAQVGNTSGKRFELENTARYLRNKLKSTIDNHMANAISKLNDNSSPVDDAVSTSANQTARVETRSIQIETDPEKVATKLRALSIKIREILIFLSSINDIDEITKNSVDSAMKKCKSELYSIQTKNEKLLHKRNKCFHKIDDIKFILEHKKFSNSIESVESPNEFDNIPSSIGSARFYDNEIKNSDSDVRGIDADAEDSAEELEKNQEVKKEVASDKVPSTKSDSQAYETYVAQVHVVNDDQDKINEDRIKSVKTTVKNLRTFIATLNNIDDATVKSSGETLRNCKRQLKNLQVSNSMLTKKRMRRLKEIDDLRAMIHEKYCEDSDDDCSCASGNDDAESKQIESQKIVSITKSGDNNCNKEENRPNHSQEDSKRVYVNSTPENVNSTPKNYCTTVTESKQIESQKIVFITKSGENNCNKEENRPNHSQEDFKRVYVNSTPENDCTSVTVRLSKHFEDIRRKIDQIFIRRSVSFDDFEDLNKGIKYINDEFDGILQRIYEIKKMEEKDDVAHDFEPQRRNATSKGPNPSNIVREEIDIKSPNIKQDIGMNNSATTPELAACDHQKEEWNASEKLLPKLPLNRPSQNLLIIENKNVIEDQKSNTDYPVELHREKAISNEPKGKTERKSSYTKQDSVYIQTTSSEFDSKYPQEKENNTSEELKKQMLLELLLDKSSQSSSIIDNENIVEDKDNDAGDIKSESRDNLSEASNKLNVIRENRDRKLSYTEQHNEVCNLSAPSEFPLDDSQKIEKNGYEKQEKKELLKPYMGRSSPDLLILDSEDKIEGQNDTNTDIIRCMSESSSKKLRIKSDPNETQTQTQSVSELVNVRETRTQYKICSEQDFNKMLANTKDNLISMRNIDLSMINSGDLRFTSSEELEEKGKINAVSTRNIDLSQMISRDSDLSLIGRHHSHDSEKHLSINENRSHLTADEYSADDGIVITFMKQSKHTECTASTSTAKETKLIQFSETETSGIHQDENKNGTESIIESVDRTNSEIISDAENRLSTLKERIINFRGLKTDDLYNELDDELVQIMLIVDDLTVDERDPLYVKRENIVKNIYKYSGLLEMKSLDHAFLDAFEGEITLVEKEMKHYLAKQKLEDLRHIVQDVEDMISEIEQKGVDYLLADRRENCIKRLKSIRDNLHIILK